MTNLQNRQLKIQEKRKKTPWKDFVMEIASRNSLNLYKNKGLTSIFPVSERIDNVIPFQKFNEIRGNAEFDYQKEIGFMDCFLQLRKRNMFRNVIAQQSNENADFVSPSFGVRNGYLSFVIGNNTEYIMYSYVVYSNCKNVLNSKEVVDGCENIFSSSSITQSYNIFYSRCITNSNNIWFCANMIGCSECILCSDLQNQSYCIRNKQYTKQEYEQLKQELLKTKSACIEEFSRMDKNDFLYGNENVKNVSNVIKSMNVENAVNSSSVKNGRNIMLVHGVPTAEEMYDVYEGGGIASDNFYAIANAGNLSHHLYCSHMVDQSTNIFYSYDLESCSFCLGCIGLKNKSYCILNKQYTKEERYEKVDEIFSQMEQNGTLGEFFPATMNPFYFNDTAAYLIDPTFTKEEVTAKGYLRRDEPIKVDIPEDAVVVKSSDLDQFEGFDAEGNWTINAEVLKQVIQDEQGNFYRIIPMEYKFLVKHGLPLPRKHWLERIKENFRIN